VKYTKVKNAHIIPRICLLPFCVDRRVAVHVDHAVEPFLLLPENAGTRRMFYKRTRPKDGSEIHDIEWSLWMIEDRAAPILERLVDDWPLLEVEAEQMPLAMLFAAQMVRTPAWMEWHEEYTRKVIAEFRAAGVHDPAELDKAEAIFLSDTQRLTKMLDLAAKLTPLLASMQWTLVEFKRPLVATSDQPVVIWPMDARSRNPSDPPVVGITNALEIRIPVTPRHLLLLTWADSFDEDASRVGGRHHAKNANAFTIAQSDRQWFHLPAANPPRGEGRLVPISPELIKGYNLVAAWSSQRRRAVQPIADGLIAQELKGGEVEFSVVTMRRRAA
jgi:hypothetical protein